MHRIFIFSNNEWFQEFWNRRRAADSSPESEIELPCKHPRLDESNLHYTDNKIEQVCVIIHRQLQSVFGIF